MKRIAIIGGGPAGILAAIGAATSSDVTIDLFEKNEKLGKKLYITGKGRCNVTNACDIADFFDHIITNKHFLYSALYTFNNVDFMELLKKNNCPLVIERGNRVFPKSGKSSDVIKALNKAISNLGVHIHLKTAIDRVTISNGAIDGVITKSGEKRSYDRVIVTTGGLSYQSTGSTGDGHRMAKQSGHHLIDGKPSLVGLYTFENWPGKLQGLSLKNVKLSLYKKNKKIRTELGEMLFTHYGISGPMVLTMSALIREDPEDYHVLLDLKPGLNEKKLDTRIQRDFEKNQNRVFKNSLGELLPSKMIPVMVECSGIDAMKKVNQITKEERRRLTNSIKNMPIRIKGLEDLDRAVVTAGGIDASDIDPATMMSKRIRNLYFAGELIDVDALTGGFNIQIAASTGFLAGIHAKEGKAVCK